MLTATELPTRSSGRFAVVVLQQSTQPLFATHFRQRHRIILWWRRWRTRFPFAPTPHEQVVFLALMRAPSVVIVDELGDEVVEMPLAKNKEVIEAFLPERLDEPLDEGHGIGGAERRFQDPQAGFLQRGVERGGELRIPVVHDDIQAQPLLLGMLHKRPALFANPGLIRMRSGGRDEHAPRIDVQENQDKQIAKARLRTWFEITSRFHPDSGMAR